MMPRHASGRSVLAPLLAVGLAACVPEATLQVGMDGYNLKLRPDREPLTTEQTAAPAESLSFGPYPVAGAEIVAPLTPRTRFAAHLPQSDCWWLAQGLHGGGDSVLANWESVFAVIGDEEILERYHDPDDGRLELGMCRFNDPETRSPVRNVDDDSETFVDFDCRRIANNTPLTLPTDGHLFNCTADTSWLHERLQAWGGSATDELLRCGQLRAGIDRVDREVASPVDFYDGIGFIDRASGRSVVGTCVSGRMLLPPQITRYRLEHSPSKERWLDPLLIPTAAGTKPARAMTDTGANVFAWATPQTILPGSDRTRWEENFSPNLAVVRVRLFELDPNGVRAYLDPSNPAPLCIEDPQTQQGCRWLCAGSEAADGRLQYDLLGGGCLDSSGRADTPAVTPVYAVRTLESAPLTQPLRWSSTLTAAPATPFIEFELVTTLGRQSLTAEPAYTDLGGARVGEHVRAPFSVVNDGELPLRITAVAVDPAHGGHPSDFTVQIPYRAEPVPLPIEIRDVTSDKITLELGRDAESQMLMTVQQDHAHARVAPRGDGFTDTSAGFQVRDDHGLLVRDQPVVASTFDPAVTPAARTSYGVRQPPFDLQPGERFEVSVLAQPGGTAERHAMVRIDAVSVLDPSQRVTIHEAVGVYGLQGPILRADPARLPYAVHGDAIERVRAVLLQNAGDSTGTVGAPQLTAVGGGPLVGDSQLALEDPYAGATALDSGDSRIVRVRYRSDCRSHVVGGYRNEAAELRWSTADGPLVVAIETSVRCIP